MSNETRTPLRSRLRPAREPDHLDYSEPDFSSWAARLDEFGPAKSDKPTQTAEAVPADSAAADIDSEGSSLQDVLQKLIAFDGAMSVAIVDSESGLILGQAGSGVDMELAAAGASTTLRARLATIKALGQTEKIDDLLISLTTQVQIIHPLPGNPKIFTYLIGDKSKSSLAMARYKATEADHLIQL